MKYLFIITSISFLLGCKNKIKKQHFGRIKIVPIYCKYDQNSAKFLDSDYKIFSKINNQILELKIPVHYNLIFDSLNYGSYFVEYNTIYNQKKVLNFMVSKPTLDKVNLCFDSMDYSLNKTNLFINQLKLGQTLVINFKSRSCFDGDEAQLKITKNDSLFTAEYKKQKINLSKPQIKLIEEFEIELRNGAKGLYSTIDTYNLYIEDTSKKYTKEDSSNKWRGFYNLINLLELKKDDK